MSTESNRCSQAARILSSLLYVLKSRHVTPTDLANLHGVSRKTVYRDLRTWDKMGIPWYYEDSPGDARLKIIHVDRDWAQSIRT